MSFNLRYLRHTWQIPPLHAGIVFCTAAGVVSAVRLHVLPTLQALPLLHGRLWLR
jgi:hypothetical protein